jgi:hypothetical protein
MTELSKVEAAERLIGLGYMPIALHGARGNTCTCSKGAACGRSAGKHPLESEWQTKPLSGMDLIETLRRRPELNLGWRMGVQPNGKRIIAIDDDGGLVDLERKLRALPKTLTQRTPSGGRHRFFLVQQGVRIRNRVKIDGVAVDVRADGGQVAFAPSRGPAGEYVLHVAPIAELPAAWLDVLTEPETPSMPDHSERCAAAESRPIVERARRYIAKMPPAREVHDGSRGAWRVALTLVRRFGLDRSDADRLLREYLTTCDGPPWTDREIAHKLDDAAKATRVPFCDLRNRDCDEWRSESWRSEWDDEALAPHPDGETAGLAKESTDGDVPGRPRIALKALPGEPHRELADVIDNAARVLGQHAPDVYCRDGHLVDVGPLDVFIGREGRRRLTTTAVGIRQMPVSEVRRRLSRCAVWTTVRYSRETRGWIEVETDPPQDVALALSNMGRWETVRPLAGVLTAPSIRPDGSIIQAAGWDEITGYLHAPDREYPPIPEQPSQDDARKALAELRNVFAPPADGFDGFPFASDGERDVPIANALTLVARPAIDGCVPAYVYDASTPGSGKGLLADTVCIIGTGSDMPKGVYTDNQDEFSKHLGSLVLAGVAVAGLDNIDQRMALCGGVLDAVLTARRPQLRILGKSEAPALDWHAVVIATGNNVQITGDTQRRCIVCRLEPGVERPELRTHYRVPDLLAHVRGHRPELVRAALTILRAYCVAGRPDVGVTPLGSFEAWSRLVVSALVYAGGHDVTRCVANRDGRTDDPELEAAKTLLTAMQRLGEPMSAGGLIGAGYDLQTSSLGESHPGFERSPEIRTALDVLVLRKGRDGRPSPAAVGRALKRIRGRIFSGLRLLSRPSAKGGCSAEWYVATAPNGSGGFGGFGSLNSRFADAIAGGRTNRAQKRPPDPPDAPGGGSRELAQ